MKRLFEVVDYLTDPKGMIQKMFPHRKITHTLSLCQDVVSVVKRLQYNVATGYIDWEFSFLLFHSAF